MTEVATRELLAEHPVVFLTVSPDAVADRLRGSNRPLLAGRTPGALEEDLRGTSGWYAEVSSATFDTSRRPMQKIADEIVAWRREQR